MCTACRSNNCLTSFNVTTFLSQWMLEVPSDLNGGGVPEAGWLVLPRPQGKPVFVIAARCETLSLHIVVAQHLNACRVFCACTEGVPWSETRMGSPL